MMSTDVFLSGWLLSHVANAWLVLSLSVTRVALSAGWSGHGGAEHGVRGSEMTTELATGAAEAWA